MPSLHDELEITYDADDDFEVPSLGGLLAELGAGPPLAEGDVVEQGLEATYFDTADYRLAGERLTLRRRTGGQDAGWHLKVPSAGESRTEVRLPLGRAVRTVPVALRRMVRAHTRGDDLVPVARITTERTVRPLVDADGRVLAEVADDRVVAERLLSTEGGDGAGPNPSASWREIEVELVDGDRQLLEAIDSRLRGLGARVAGTRSKLARALGDAVPGAVGVEKSSKPTPRSRAGEVALAYLSGQVQQVLTQDVQVRMDTPDSVHKMRVASRRLRSALQTFKPVFDADAVGPLRAELTWLAGELGAARDAEVLRDRLRASLDGQSGTGSPSSARDATEELSRAYRRAHDSLLAELDSDRYFRLLDALRQLCSEPPLSTKADRRAQKVLPARVARAYAALETVAEAALQAPSGQERDELLHEARKDAKRARYAGEALAPVFGEDAAQFARAMEAVQEELGEHQDSVVMRERLLALAREASDPQAAFELGRLYAREEDRGRRAEERFEQAWQAASRKSLRRWLR